MEFMELIQARYSCKKYNGEAVPAEKLAAILEAGRLAPTAKNTQEHHVYVAQSAEVLAKIDAVTPCRYNAPTVLVVCGNKKLAFTYPGGAATACAEDATIVATHLMLAAADQGVQSCWVNFFNPAELAAALGLPEDEEIVMLLDLGYAAEDGVALPNHFSRKPIDETVSYL